VKRAKIDRFTNRVVFVADVVFVGMTPIVAYVLRFDGLGWMPTATRTAVVFAGLALVTKLVTFAAAGLYRRPWHEASVGELMLIVKAVVVASVVVGVLGCFVLPATQLINPRVPYSVPVIDGLLSMAAAGGARFSIRVAGGVPGLETKQGSNGNEPAS
jgi:FlaA1/EpsC-like NDP-sugar epimerase